MAMKELGKLLEQRSGREVNWALTVAEWQRDVENLCHLIETWVEPLRAEDKLAIDRHIDETAEIGLGGYRTKGLSIRFSDLPGEVRIRAKSALVVGVRLESGAMKTGIFGRVDMTYGASDLPVVRKRPKKLPPTWWIGFEASLVALNEDSLDRAFRTLMQL